MATGVKVSNPNLSITLIKLEKFGSTDPNLVHGKATLIEGRQFKPNYYASNVNKGWVD